MSDDARGTRAPTNVGSLQLHKGKLQSLFSMPSDALVPVLQMAIGERFRFAVFGGHRLRYGRAEIHRYRLHMTIDEDDLPPE